MKLTEKQFWVYILECENGSYYVGYTTDLLRRYQEHLMGTKACKYTRSFKPRSIVQYWFINGDKAQAMRVERYVKRLTKSAKQRLIASPGLLIPIFGESIKTNEALRLIDTTAAQKEIVQ
jgi:putative endonuclease